MTTSASVPAKKLMPGSETWQGTQYDRINAKGVNGIAVTLSVSGDSAREMWLPFEPGLKLLGYPSLNEVRQGDTVNVTYEYLEDGSEMFLKRLALLKRASEGQP